MFRMHNLSSTRNASPRALSLAIATTLAIAAIAPALATSAAGGVSSVAQRAVINRGDVVTGALPQHAPMHIEVALSPRNRDQLDRFIAAAAQPHAAVHAMAHAQLVANHLPTQAQADLVARYLARMGFKNIVIAPNRMLVSADGTAAAASSAFATSFVQVRTRDGRTTYANSTDALVPNELKGIVLAVLGLEDVQRVHSFARKFQPGGLHPMTVTGHNPKNWPVFYNGTGVTNASTMTIGIITQGKLDQTILDLNQWTTANSLPTVTTQTVNTNGTSTDTSGTIEWDLDSQDIVGMAGGSVNKLIFYNQPTLSFTNLTANFNTVVSANATKIINVSLGLCETSVSSSTRNAEDAIFQLGVAQGQTFSVSSGDSGADECGDGGTTPSYPASSPYVVAVGGTTLDTTGATVNSETVWVDGGGSASLLEAQPAWQAPFVTGSFRGVPDVAFAGDPASGAQIIFNGSLTQVGGTSLSAPIFAAAWARILAGHPSLGFAAPNLYRTLKAADYRDITVGNNGGSAAGAGWDFATGFGSFNLAAVDARFTGLPTLSVSDPTITEGDSGTKTANFVVTMSAASADTVGFSFATADGTATGTDYVARPRTARSFAPGATQTTIGVSVNGDTTNEPNETFFLNLSSPIGATIADAQGAATIQNDDGAALPTLTVSNATVTEGNSGTKQANFVVTLSAPSASPVTFKFATADGTAAGGTDYDARALTGRSIAAGLTQTTIGVLVDGDTDIESDETFFLNISNVSGASVGTSQGTGTITNDD